MFKQPFYEGPQRVRVSVREVRRLRHGALPPLQRLKEVHAQDFPGSS